MFNTPYNIAMNTKLLFNSIIGMIILYNCFYISVSVFCLTLCSQCMAIAIIQWNYNSIKMKLNKSIGRIMINCKLKQIQLLNLCSSAEYDRFTGWVGVKLRWFKYEWPCVCQCVCNVLNSMEFVVRIDVDCDRLKRNWQKKNRANKSKVRW